MQELLESYLIDFNALESKIEYTRSQIQNAEELVRLRYNILSLYFASSRLFSKHFWRVISHWFAIDCADFILHTLPTLYPPIYTLCSCPCGWTRPATSC